MHLPPEDLIPAPLPPDWPEPEALGFGQHLGPYLVEAGHSDSAGWAAPVVTPRAAAPVAVASGVTQYGLSVFEGIKAYRAHDGRVHLFRPFDHARRLRDSARRLAMPEPPDELFMQLARLAVQVHERYVPPHGRGALYLRPTLFADEECLGLRPAHHHRFSIAVMPCSDPAPKTLRLWAEPELIRAAPGGLGAAKTGANYAAGIGGLLRARERGYDDVAWLDAATHTQLGEAGTMNLFVQIGAEVLTPPLDGTILAGITRDSVIRLLRETGTRVSEQAVSLDELAAAQTAGVLGTAFGVGTAARLVRITEISDDRRFLTFPDTGLTADLAAALKAVQEGPAPGRTADRHSDWRVAVT